MTVADDDDKMTTITIKAATTSTTTAKIDKEAKTTTTTTTTTTTPTTMKTTTMTPTSTTTIMAETRLITSNKPTTKEFITTNNSSSSTSITAATTTTTASTILKTNITASTTANSLESQTSQPHHHHHHHHHQHQRKHNHQHNHQHNHHHNHNNHASKTPHKHGQHRQRKISPSGASRKHHHQPSTLSVGYSDIKSFPARNDEGLPGQMVLSNSNDNVINQLAEKDFSANSLGGGVVFEHTAGGVRTTSLEELDFGRARVAIYPKSSTTISTTTRDSNIHIVKPERLPEIIPSTPVSSNSKIIEIKAKTNKKVKRETVEIEPEYLVGELNLNDSSEYIAELNPGDSTATATPILIGNVVNTGPASANGNEIVRLDGFAGMLQLFFGIEKPIDVAVFSHPPSAEFINLLFALMVWCVRYPAVFWTTAKSFATIFSVQIIASASDIIFSFVGISTLYKLQIYSEALPIQNHGLVLNATVTLLLFLLSTLLMISSSMIMYLYGHGRLAAKMRDRSLITLKSSDTWIYFAHCASLCYVLALAVVKAPLLNDLSATYRQNLHCPTFMAALVSVMHLLLWIVIWLGLSAKRRWSFKLPPLDAYGIIGKATTQPLLMHNRGSLTSSAQQGGNLNTATAVSNGTTIAGGGGGGSLEQKSNIVGGVGGSLVSGIGSVMGTGNHHLSNTSSSDVVSGTPADDIYWPKLTPSSPKLKVTFNEVPSTSDDDQLLIGDHEQNDGKRDSPCGTTVCFTSATGEIDDGEYATLRSATAATVVGIAVGCGSGVANKGGIGAMTKTHTPPVGGVKVLHLSEFDELPPPPPHMMSSMTITSHTATVSVNINASNVGGGCSGNSTVDYVNCTATSDDNISEEGKLLACVRDDSVTYASTRDLEPPLPPPPPPTHNHQQQQTANKRAPHAMPEVMQLSSSPEHLVSPLAPVTVTVHTNEAHIASSSTPRCIRRADSGVPQEALTPRSDTNSMGTESTTSPPERAPSESSSGVHSAEERDVEVVIRPRAACKPPAKPPQPAIQEEPYGRCTNMRMTSFTSSSNTNSATLPLQRTAPEQKFDYSQHCSTMPLPTTNQHNYNYQQNQNQSNAYTTSAHSMTQSHHNAGGGNLSSFKTPLYANSGVALQGHFSAQPPPLPPPPTVTHTVLPNGARYSNPNNILKRLPHVKTAESPYGYSGLGAGHHTFAKPGYENSLVNTSIPEDRDSANYSMTSEQDCLYATASALQ
uniref:Protein tincar n=1 Tax=Glossina austeni TaxID=7395 RepID=A0A1A9VR80_GLOAU